MVTPRAQCLEDLAEPFRLADVVANDIRVAHYRRTPVSPLYVACDHGIAVTTGDPLARLTRRHRPWTEIYTQLDPARVEHLGFANDTQCQNLEMRLSGFRKIWIRLLAAWVGVPRRLISARIAPGFEPSAASLQRRCRRWMDSLSADYDPRRSRSTSRGTLASRPSSSSQPASIAPAIRGTGSGSPVGSHLPRRSLSQFSKWYFKQ